jgi:hypothetical protein
MRLHNARPRPTPTLQHTGYVGRQGYLPEQGFNSAEFVRQLLTVDGQSNTKRNDNGKMAVCGEAIAMPTGSSAGRANCPRLLQQSRCRQPLEAHILDPVRSCRHDDSCGSKS